MQYKELNNGVRMPMLGYGVYQTPVEETERCVADALEVGYRLSSTAQCDGNERASEQPSTQAASTVATSSSPVKSGCPT